MAIFMKGLSQVIGLTFVYKYSQLKPKTWIKPHVNTAPGEHLCLCKSPLILLVRLVWFPFIAVDCILKSLTFVEAQVVSSAWI